MIQLRTPSFGPRSGLVPRWVIYTGCGCLLLLLLAAGGLYFGASWLKTNVLDPAMDSEAQWPKLQALLPFEQRPLGLELQMGLDLMSVQMFVLQQGSLQVMVMNLPEADAQSTKDAVTDPSSYKGLFGLGERKNAEKMQITIQGVERKGMRFLQEGVRGPNGMTNGASVILDMSKEGSLRPLLVQLTRIDSSSEAIADDEIHRFFEPFHVGQR
jgi:hypothetical protein